MRRILEFQLKSTDFEKRSHFYSRRCKIRLISEEMAITVAEGANFLYSISTLLQLLLHENLFEIDLCDLRFLVHDFWMRRSLPN